MSNDLEAVKAMMLQALNDAYTHGRGQAFKLEYHNAPDELWFDDNTSYDFDKLARAVSDYFAAQQPVSNVEFQDQDGEWKPWTHPYRFVGEANAYDSLRKRYVRVRSIDLQASSAPGGQS